MNVNTFRCTKKHDAFMVRAIQYCQRRGGGCELFHAGKLGWLHVRGKNGEWFIRWHHRPIKAREVPR